ncbi:MAG: sugar transferase [Candidatus Taylorbacteria bacterium]|nr:sugar transferase [Candidatus Taylorbacteria bacterium]
MIMPMTGMHKREFPVLILGDIVLLVLSLILTLTVRFHAFPTLEVFESHLVPFTYLFVAFLLIAFIAGLYENHTLFLKGRLPQLLLNVQIAQAIVAIALFYFIPYFSITPKIVLFLYLLISLMLLAVWRIFVAPNIGSKKPSRAVMIGEGKEMHELMDEINHNPRYGIYIVEMIAPDGNAASIAQTASKLADEDPSLVVILDMHHGVVENVLPLLYELIFKGVRFVNVTSLYEDIFNREPVSLLGQAWFIENISSAPKTVYDFCKRLSDTLIAAMLGIISLILYPFVIAAIKIQDGGPIFIYQKRVGQNGGIINIMKFRTMTANDEGKWANGASTGNAVTSVGKILRKSRIDELPQLWNVLRGDISLIGPRPELPEPVREYAKAIPYYNVRHIVKPGLSGWAQIYHEQHPHHGLDIDETRNKLSYDLYYIKNRSAFIDLKIGLRTVKVLLTFVGR